MSDITVIDLSQLPAPDIVETLDYEALLQEYYAEFTAKDPSYDALLESDPAMILLQVAAYREIWLRNRINEAAKANLLAYAMGSDLDQKAAGYGVSRLIGEDDERLRYRCQISLEGYSTAGSVGAYIFHALSASVKVKSVDVRRPTPGVVAVTVLSIEGEGTPSERETLMDIEVKLEGNAVVLDGKHITQLVVKEVSGNITYTEDIDYVFDIDNSLLLRTIGSAIPENSVLVLSYERAAVLELVRLALNADDTRPLTDCVMVEAAQIVPYEIEAHIVVYPGPSFAVVENESRALLESYVEERHVMGGLVALSGIYDALHTTGVKKVDIFSPLSDIETTKTQAPYCTRITLTTTVDYD
jgi:phage-related baseplate assembly protein